MTRADELRALDRQVADVRGPGFYGGLPGEMAPPYSLDPQMSRVLLDEMAANGGYAETYRDRAQSLSTRFWCCRNDDRTGFWGPTLDIAICRAYIAWKEATK